MQPLKSPGPQQPTHNFAIRFSVIVVIDSFAEK